MYKSVIENQRKNFSEAVEYFHLEAGKIRTGRANPSLLENITVDYYGTKTLLKQMASINAPEPRTLIIQPWDKGSLVNIEAAVRESGLGFNPVNDGQVVRVNIPPLTEERRKEMAKVLNQKAEEGRIAIRGVREDAWKKIQDLAEEGTISEDEKFAAKDALQKVVDEYNKKIEEIKEKKEKEIMTV